MKSSLQAKKSSSHNKTLALANVNIFESGIRVETTHFFGENFSKRLKNGKHSGVSAELKKFEMAELRKLTKIS